LYGLSSSAANYKIDILDCQHCSLEDLRI